MLVAADVPTPVWVAFLTGGVPLVLGVLSWVTMRRAAAATAAKDQGAAIREIVDAGSLARKDLVEEVTRLAGLCDGLQAQINAANERAVQDRRECDRQLAGMRVDMAQEVSWSHRLTAALRAAGVSVPERES